MDNLKNLKNLLDVMKGDHLGREELVTTLEKVVEFVLKIEQKNSDAIDQLEQTYSAVMYKVQNDHHSSLSELKDKTNKLFVGEKMDSMYTEHMQRMSEVNQKMDSMYTEHMQRMSEVNQKMDEMSKVTGMPGEKEDVGDNGLDGSPDSAEDIVDKLESLPEREKLAIEAIKNLRQELDTLKKSVAKPTFTGSGGGSRRGDVKAYDISTQLNGVLKTFALPAFWRIISVSSSSFPNAFRETVDWTQDATLMKLTFTSAIDATTTLATGQTITIIYAEA